MQPPLLGSATHYDTKFASRLFRGVSWKLPLSKSYLINYRTSVVSQALAGNNPSKNPVQPPRLALPTPAGTLTGSAGGKSVDTSTPSSPTTPCPTNRRKRKLDATDATGISGG